MDSYPSEHDSVFCDTALSFNKPRSRFYSDVKSEVTAKGNTIRRDSERICRTKLSDSPQPSFLANFKGMKLFQMFAKTPVHTHKQRPDPIRGACKINDNLVVFDLDTGADISALSSDVYERLNPKPKLVNIDREIHSAGGAMKNVL
ncbi:unnamed protein product [Brachionus calyciflorus]|uniref:Peptidase A2 domain-containing protein n=1 Tax=Brachionus calyciflorus TaxID=104777 RepID=A0A813TIZ7_9BILA|nr:unnamed protein product [Brachionus calyciflorus]